MNDSTFGETLRDLRLSAGVSLRTLADRAHCSHGHLADLEAGRRRPGVSLAVQLDSVLGAAGLLVYLAPGAPDSTAFGLRSHKFLAAHLEPDAVARIIADSAAETVPDLLSSHTVLTAAHPTADEATLHVWSHGAAIYHLVEERQWPNLRSLARWRYHSYSCDLPWTSNDLSRRSSSDAATDYALSAYWVTDPAWQGDRLDTALRLLCMPRVLVGDSPEDDNPLTEETLLRDGFSHDDLVPFGVADAALAYASWAGVVYRPLDATRALRESELVDMELAVQALWSHCSWLARQIEAGRDPEVDPEHGWRWLRAVRSKLATARPQEPSPHRSMREAILATSGLPGMLDEALTTLRESQK